MVDLDAIKAMWRGLDGKLWVSRTEEDWLESEVVITTKDDGNPADAIATVTCDHAERLATLWAGAAPQVAELVAEVERLRAIVEGRPTAPTREEVGAHRGLWMVAFPSGDVDIVSPVIAQLLRRREAIHAGCPVRWWPLRDGRLCAWPEVSRG